MPLASCRPALPLAVSAARPRRHPAASETTECGGLRRWGFCLTAMAGLHAAVLAAAVNGIHSQAAARPAQAVMTIELAPLQPAPATPRIKPEPRPKTRQQVRENPAAPTKPKPAKVQPAARHTAESVSMPVAFTTPAPATDIPVQAPEPTAMPMPVRSTAIPTWQGEVLAHLERHKRYPRSARLRRSEGVTVVRFVMDRGGRVVSVRLERPSGSGLLDEESLALLERAQPLPPPPDEITGDRIELVVPVQFQLR